MRTSKFISVTAFVTAVMLLSAGFAVASPPDHANGNNAWSVKVTGGGDATAGGVDFSLTMSASDVGGQWQYTSADGTQVAHGTIETLVVAEDLSSAYMSGPVAHVSAGTTFTEGESWTIAVLEDGDGSGDKVRICKTSNCGNGGASYPGIYYDGNINIRSK